MVGNARTMIQQHIQGNFIGASEIRQILTQSIFCMKNILLLEPKHPRFREWMLVLIQALTEAIDDPCDVLSLAQEELAEPEWVAKWSKAWPSAAERNNHAHGIPGGATPLGWGTLPWEGRSIGEMMELSCWFNFGDEGRLPPSR